MCSQTAHRGGHPSLRATLRALAMCLALSCSSLAWSQADDGDDAEESAAEVELTGAPAMPAAEANRLLALPLPIRERRRAHQIHAAKCPPSHNGLHACA